MKSVSIYTLLLLGIICLSCNLSSPAKELALKNAATNGVSVAKNASIITTEKGIQFIEQDWDKALKNAQDQGKLVFLDIYAVWCGPCKMLKQYTFTDEKVGDFFNKNFINVSVDGEKGVGPQLAEKYAIEGYPSLIVADATGKPVLITAGYIPSDVLMKFASEALKRGGVSPK